MFADAVEHILKQHCTPAAVRGIERGESPAALWDAIAEAGLLDLLTPEASGGAGLHLAEMFPLFLLFGRYAAPVPVAQSIAARALVADQAAIPRGMLTMAPQCQRQGDAIVCPLTPAGMLADHVLASNHGTLILLDCASADRVPTGVHGSLTATLKWEHGSRDAIACDFDRGMPAYGAAIHAALLAGAMHRTLALTLRHANDRVQFGKPIGTFQAVQHQISVMAEQVAAASIASEAAFHSGTRVPMALAAAVAKSRASEATAVVSSIAHAVHGAIGIAEDHDLHLYTRRLHEWRIAHGSEACWNQFIGEQVLRDNNQPIMDFVRAIHA